MRNSRHAGKSLISNAAWPALMAAALLASLAAAARADKPKGCESFKWPVQRDAALLQAPGKPILQSGASAAIDGKAF
ncbi:MAG: hypothetical protein P4L76_15600, partial [Beijerinckiaceae bacterium]|nr:hypothetical protein [Beijerinckiaceae bacterium]